MPFPEAPGPSLIEGRLRFQFRPGWRVKKYDDSQHHQRRFQGSLLAPKACDFVALEPNGGLWLIEVKDHSVAGRSTARGNLFAEVVEKYRDTLAGLVGMGQFQGSHEGRSTPKANQEARFAKACLQALGAGHPLHLVLHLKQGIGSRFFNKSNQLIKFQQACACFTPSTNVHFEGHPLRATGPWTVVEAMQNAPPAGGHAN